MSEEEKPSIIENLTDAVTSAVSDALSGDDSDSDSSVESSPDSIPDSDSDSDSSPDSDSDSSPDSDSDEEDATKEAGESLKLNPNVIATEDVSRFGDGSPSEGDDDDSGDDDDDDDSDDEYFQKFDKEVRKQHLQEFHPESFTHNYDEIAKLTRVVRDKDGVIIDELHRTVPILTKYEYTRILGIRAKQISAGATIFVKVPETMIDSYLIAKQELQEKKVPFIIRRPIPNGGSEYWNVQDLELLHN